MTRIGNIDVGADGRVDSRSTSTEELAHILDVLLIAKKVKQGDWQFPDLVALLDQISKVNPHQQHVEMLIPSNSPCVQSDS